MKKRVNEGVALLLTGSLLVYLWPKQPPDDVLVRMQDILGKLEEMYDGDTIIVRSSYFRPDGLEEDDVRWVRERMREAGLTGSSFSCSAGECTSFYDIDVWIDIVPPQRYYKYSSDNRIEEWIVDDISTAIEENDKSYYAFCKRTEVEHWFYCESDL
ncbi:MULTISPECIES: hypothetical protein [Halomonas]|uniref:hypothetical protein n=1 Tax=Halomonas TaxID=2745 RepID=UPI001C9487D4|nr:MULTISPECIES: hypothetical protein [Halomonas]MBY6207942.1 hypothetical protein [Halomonas sp. DP3Y7-2]MBY6228751.1 hypothetical protein [Halomonas sp. DP3Y7-1]MCA0917265.1 hypothetical protein [Halomonas denitrificans]